MDRIRITGGKPLHGTIPISGAKNAALPLMIASLLTEDMLILENVPHLADVVQLQRILNNHGVDLMRGRSGFLSAAHTEADIAATIAAFAATLDEIAAT